MSENSISKTAYYCCGARLQDAESCNPVCDDGYAKVFMDKTGMEIYKNFDNKKLKTGKAVNATRHRVIDDLLRDRIKTESDTIVILIGAGFDNRAYRIPGGRWIEIDDPRLIAIKNKHLPISKCKNMLERIPYDYKRESLENKLPSFDRGESIIVVLEGVVVYLYEKEIQHILDILRVFYPRHTLVCDLQTHTFFKKYTKSLSKIMNSLGSPFRINSDKPEEIFIQNGYGISERVSIIEKTVAFGKVWIPIT